jgi:hypothetical protein
MKPQWRSVLNVVTREEIPMVPLLGRSAPDRVKERSVAKAKVASEVSGVDPVEQAASTEPIAPHSTVLARLVEQSETIAPAPAKRPNLRERLVELYAHD